MGASFTCAICCRDVCVRWNPRHGPGRALPPLCQYCEQEYSRGTAKPSAGSFGDRREVMRGFALTEALRAEAARAQWGRRHEA